MIKLHVFKPTTIIVLAGCIYGNSLLAQVPLTPASTKPGQKTVADNLKPVTKADLTIVAVSLLSASGGNSEWDIKISVTVKNTGGLQAPACKLKAWAQNAAAGANPWKELALLDLPAIRPGASLTKEYQIHDQYWVMHKIPAFNLKLAADAGNQVAESNENNNESAIVPVLSSR